MLKQTYTSYEPVTSWTFNFEDLHVGEGEVVDNVISHRTGNGTMFFSPIMTLQPGFSK
jgi:hypothetical protein